ncbi:MAG: hypothetical protein VX904_13900, partial [Planctomycetota bacterium]|nr:hypothetical protein [Planctomycetota bacterium]
VCSMQAWGRHFDAASSLPKIGLGSDNKIHGRFPSRLRATGSFIKTKSERCPSPPRNAPANPTRFSFGPRFYWNEGEFHDVSVTIKNQGEQA